MVKSIYFNFNTPSKIHYKAIYNVNLEVVHAYEYINNNNSNYNVHKAQLQHTVTLLGLHGYMPCLNCNCILFL